MANSLLTIDMITREAVMLFKNSNEFIQNINRQYDDSFAVTGAKIGTSLRIRLPNDFTVRNGAAASPQDTNETSTTLVVSTQRGVDLSFTSLDMAMNLDDFSERILAPAINNLAGNIAVTIMSGVEGGISNLVSNVDGTGAIIPPTASTYLEAGAILSQNSAQRQMRKIMNDPVTEARVITSLSGLFNPTGRIAQQYDDASMKRALGFDWFMDQTVIKHTTGSFTAGTVNGADQTGTTLVTNAITGTLNAGDIITLEDVNSVNRVNKQTNGTLCQFAVTADAANGATSLSIYPAIIPFAANGSEVQYQTVDASPASGADILLVTQANEVYRKNFGYVPQAVTMATADLPLPAAGVVEAARRVYDGVSMRMISDYVIMTDQFVTRLDVLFGSLWVRPEWACVIADSVDA